MIVTLLTDFGLEDEYAGVMKGVILRVNPSAQVVDLCHQVPPGDVTRAAWLLSWSWSYFPEGTVHAAVVDPGVGSARRILCCEHRGHRFLAPDNGLLSVLLTGVRKPRLFSVTQRKYWLPRVSDTFHGRDIFAPVAGYLSLGLDPRRLGPRVHSLKRLAPSRPTRSARSGTWKGRVVDLDRFGNAVTDLPWGALGLPGRGAKVEVWVKGRRIGWIRRSYAGVPVGMPLAIVGSRGLLEIAVNRGSAARDLGLEVGDEVEVKRR